jgi:hypothetical protein
MTPHLAPPSSIIDDFSLVEGGPIYRLQSWIRMTIRDRSRVWDRAAIAIAVTWVPLLLLSLAEGTAWGSHVKIPLLSDYATNIRFLFTLPLMIVAQRLINRRARHAVKHFVDAELVTRDAFADYERIVLSTLQFRNSWIPALVLMILAFIPSVLSIHPGILPGISTWRTAAQSGDLTWAGWWFMFISLPLYRVLLFWWGWLLILWASFLLRVTRLPLCCIPTHPDGAGGLGFLGETQMYFGLIALAASAGVAGDFANLLAYEGAMLAGLKFQMIGVCVLVFALMLAPLLVVTPKLNSVKERGLLEYSTLGAFYVRDFDEKWVRGQRPGNEALLGSSDIQSLADLNNSFSVVHEMRRVLVSRDILLGLALPTVVPMLLPIVVATPVDEIFKEVVKLLA